MTSEVFTVSDCPTCGSRRIERVRGTWSGRYKGKPYEVARLEYYSCPDCGEKVYPAQAMRRIQEASPGYSRRAARPQTRARLAPNTTAGAGG
jgi:YgiT-type zinc finger domain-containing protein